MTNKPFTEKTSASGTIAGFDFQYYYFLYKLLTLKKDETIGFEVLDDLHTQLNNDHQVLIQTKHTVQKKADGTAANLTELDPDLWKTISNWATVITDEIDGRSDKKSQLHFLKRTTFILASNKSSNPKNIFFTKLSEFKQGNINLSDFKKYVKTLLVRISDENDHLFRLKVITVFG